MLKNRRDIVIVGGGPAGMMAGLLFARSGLKVAVLEKHADFLRDFRGDTVHPSTLDLFHQLGMLNDLLELPHSRVNEASIHIAGRQMKAVDFRYLPVAAPYIAMMPQWDLLDFIAARAKQYSGFTLHMETEAVGLLYDQTERVSGVETKDGQRLEAKLVIAADGRRSVLRDKAELPLRNIGAPMDVFWFRVDKPRGYGGDVFGTVQAGRFMVMIDRRDYYQCAFVFNKGQADEVRAAGLEAFRAGLRSLVPDLSEAFNQLTSWDQVKMLEVALDRLERWHRPGLLAIGDAAHAMSPIGGVGINVAIQDAVTAANILAGPMKSGEDPDPLLKHVYARRIGPVRRMQALQKLAQDRVVAPLLRRTKPITKPFMALRLLNSMPWLRRLPGRVIGLGFGREAIQSPEIPTSPK
ncbi:MAG: 2-polyprenyl-6-methoxyphenol hydroxylase-like FAD-dependent oxidoreductase [Parasphingorhabdus sp.]|jgi:2-polyprenyl-6-methoxyphenol hydroxylase-like FAD-dependent oxidoreductase|uniref:FAD-dependent oxidoreductase n=1 Tax=Parasphingorhabdus sp. TaxID=2709688 RepID=UPI0039E6879D